LTLIFRHFVAGNQLLTAANHNQGPKLGLGLKRAFVTALLSHLV
jgi:hypothetical protein